MIISLLFTCDTHARTTRSVRWPRLWSESSTLRRWPPPGTARRWTLQQPLLPSTTSTVRRPTPRQPPACLSPPTTVRTLCARPVGRDAFPLSAACAAGAVVCGAVRTQRRLLTFPTVAQQTVGAADRGATGSDASTLFYTNTHTHTRRVQ